MALISRPVIGFQFIIEGKPMENDIINAITEQRVLELDYMPGMRMVEPHAYGRSANGDLLLRAYQTSGASSSGEHEHWKLLRLDRANMVQLTDEIFDGPRPGYRRGDKAMKGGIIAEL